VYELLLFSFFIQVTRYISDFCFRNFHILQNISHFNKSENEFILRFILPEKYFCFSFFASLVARNKWRFRRRLITSVFQPLLAIRKEKAFLNKKALANTAFKKF